MVNKTLIYLIIAFIVICMGAYLFLTTKIIKENSVCTQNPFTYAANTIIDQNGNVIYYLCTCHIGTSEFYFDKEGVYKENPLIKELYMP